MPGQQACTGYAKDIRRQICWDRQESQLHQVAAQRRLSYAAVQEAVKNTVHETLAVMEKKGWQKP